MTNTSKAEAFSLRIARAAYLKQLCTDERWSGRQIALKTGVPHSTIAAKLKGESPIEIDDIALFERVLKMEKGELYVKLLEVDSNHQPAGFKSAPEFRRLTIVPDTSDAKIAPLAARTTPRNTDHIAPVTRIRAHA